MRVWIVTVGEPLPTDSGSPRLLRSGALARYLVHQGHEVTWFNSRFDHTHKRLRRELPQSFSHEGVQIHLLEAIGYNRNVSLARVWDQRVSASDFIMRAPSLVAPDVVLCSLPTLELCKAVGQYCDARSVPYLLDVRDLWPDVYYRSVPGPLRPLLRGALFGQEKLADKVLRSATGVIGISPGYLQWALQRAARSQTENDHMIPLGYEFQPLTSDERADAQRAVARFALPSDRPIVWYVGTFGQQYDLVPVIRAAQMFDGRADSPTFVISGVGELGRRWEELSRGLSNVIFTGWITRPELGWLRQNAAIGLQPYVTGAPQGLANKTFEYLSAGLPVVSSLDGENRQLLEDVGAGIYYNNRDDSCYEAIRRLITDEPLRTTLSRNAENVYRSRFSSEAIFGRLSEALFLAAARSKLTD